MCCLPHWNTSLFFFHRSYLRERERRRNVCYYPDGGQTHTFSDTLEPVAVVVVVVQEKERKKGPLLTHSFHRRRRHHHHHACRPTSERLE